MTTPSPAKTSATSSPTTPLGEEGDQESENLRLLTIGDSGVGKSWLLLRWTQGDKIKLHKKDKPTQTIGVDFGMKNIMLNGHRMKIKVWDTAGQERFRTITTSYYRNAQGILLVYDISNRESFLNVRHWIAEIELHTRGHIAIILIGNKCDLLQERVVSIEEGQALAREYQIPFYETSALKNINVDEAFHTLAQEILNLQMKEKLDPKSEHRYPPLNHVPLKPLPPPRRSWCFFF